MLKAPATASSPAHPSSHPPITRWGRRNGQQCLKQTDQKSEQRREEREKETAGGEGGGRRTQVCCWEIQEVRARERCLSGYPPSPCLCFSFLCLSSWPLGFLTPVSAAISQPSPVTVLAPVQPPAGGRCVASRAWTSHCCCKTVQALWRTKRDRGAADLRSRDDRQKPVHRWVLHPRINAS